jgi:hypothetical protein
VGAISETYDPDQEIHSSYVRYFLWLHCNETKEMNLVRHFGIATYFVMSLLLVSGGIQAETGAVGNVEVGVGELFITPSVPYAELQVTVAGGNVYWQKRFAPDERVNVLLTEIGVVSDGSYGYEIIAAPAIDKAAWEAAEGDEAAEQRLDAEEAASTYLQQGGFQVVSGQVVKGESGNEFNANNLPSILQE